MSPTTEYDAAWKATLETFLQPCLAIAFPALADQINWSAPPRFLDTELQEIVRDSESGPMRVDKLVEVSRRDGEKELLLVHVEVQAQRDDDLPRRMFQYFCRIFDRFGRAPRERGRARGSEPSMETQGVHPVLRRVFAPLSVCDLQADGPRSEAVDRGGESGGTGD